MLHRVLINFIRVSQCWFFYRRNVAKNDGRHVRFKRLISITVIYYYTFRQARLAGSVHHTHTHTHIAKDSHTQVCSHVSKTLAFNLALAKVMVEVRRQGRDRNREPKRVLPVYVCLCVCVCECLWVVRGASSYTTTATKSSYLIVHLKRFGSMVIHHCHAMGECLTHLCLPDSVA